MPISIHTREDEGVWLVEMAGAMSAVDSLDLHAKLLPAVPEEPRLMVFDMSGVEIMPSLGIGTMMSFTRALEARGCTVRFAAVQANVLEMIKRCKLDTVWSIYPTVEEAKAG